MKLLFRWKGSFYKLIWKDILVYFLLFGSLQVIYRLALPPEGKEIFEQVSALCKNFSFSTPVTFILGFYVSILVARWWEEFQLIPWPHTLAVLVSSYIDGNDEEGRLLRRTIMRYINLCIVLTLRMISLPVKKRFPTIKHLVDAGLIIGKESCVRLFRFFLKIFMISHLQFRSLAKLTKKQSATGCPLSGLAN